MIRTYLVINISTLALLKKLLIGGSTLSDVIIIAPLIFYFFLKLGVGPLFL